MAGTGGTGGTAAVPRGSATGPCAAVRPSSVLALDARGVDRPDTPAEWPSASALERAASSRASASASAGSSSTVSSKAVGMDSPVSTHASSSASWAAWPVPPRALPMPLRASVSSLGMIHILLESPRASCGSTWRYW